MPWRQHFANSALKKPEIKNVKFKNVQCIRNILELTGSSLISLPLKKENKHKPIQFIQFNRYQYWSIWLCSLTWFGSSQELHVSLNSSRRRVLKETVDELGQNINHSRDFLSTFKFSPTDNMLKDGQKICFLSLKSIFFYSSIENNRVKNFVSQSGDSRISKIS